jgi:hypothetical protein
MVAMTQFAGNVVIGVGIGIAICGLWCTAMISIGHLLARRSIGGLAIMLALVSLTSFGSLKAEELLFAVFNLPLPRGASVATLIWVFFWLFTAVWVIRRISILRQKMENP